MVKPHLCRGRGREAESHRNGCELDLLVDVLSGELYVAEVLLELEGELAVQVGLDDALVVLQADNDALQPADEPPCEGSRPRGDCGAT